MSTQSQPPKTNPPTHNTGLQKYICPANGGVAEKPLAESRPNNSNREFREPLETQRALKLQEEHAMCSATLQPIYKSMVHKQTNMENIEKIINIFIQCMVKYTHAHDHTHAWLVLKTTLKAGVEEL